MYPPFKNLVRKVLSDNQIVVTFVDIGSRNGIIDLPGLAPFTDAYGFEPNPAEYDKLLTGKTDSSLLGQKIILYKSVNYSPYALADFEGNADFYITKGPGACGMLKPDLERLREIHWKGGIFKENFGDDVFSVEKVIRVPVKSLAVFAQERRLDCIDYLKVDVEGSEYEVLQGAGDFLKNIGVIKAEVCFIPFRENQKIFSEIDLFLRKNGFDLLRYEMVPDHVGFKERVLPWTFYPSVGIPEKFSQPLQADAIYINRFLGNKSRLIAQAAILIEKNYLDEALFVLRRRAKIQNQALFSLLENYRGDQINKLLNYIFHISRRARDFLSRILRKF